MTRALIFESPHCPAAAQFDIAGRPLLLRQLQWLRDNGISRVAIEIAGDSHTPALANWLRSEDPLLGDCVFIPTDTARGPRGLAMLAGIPDDEIVLALPSDVLAQGALPDPLAEGRYTLFAPKGHGHAPPLELLVSAMTASEPTARLHEGWGVRIGNAAEAHALSCAALTGDAPGILVHGAEVRPGVWFGRGARVADDAKLCPPVLVGPDTRVLARAEVGPNVTIAQGCVVERDAKLSDCSVAANTLVGEGTRARGAHLSEAHMTSLADDAVTMVEDPLVLTRVRAPARIALSSRLAAALMIAPLLLPWLLVTLVLLPWRRPFRTVQLHGTTLHDGSLGVPLLDRYPALLDVVMGLRALVGATDVTLLGALPRDLGLPAAALDVLPALAPAASRDTQLRLLRWYAMHKSRELDLRLWTGRVS